MEYGFNVYQTQVDDHVFWVAESKDLKGCIGQGETLEEAISELKENEREWLETAGEVGIDIPKPTIEPMNAYSGKFMTRVSSFVHKAANEQAKKQGISLNQYVNNAIVTMNAAFSTAEGVKCAVNEVKDILFASSGHMKYKRDNILQYPGVQETPVSLKILQS